ncbi:MAG: hypothetical protein DRH30_03240 [Deltaproteobacteria bacterium]|nr:MAG: hypothetical protein DRH30_03240 [Deltaproteobacteria bacterium]
MTRENVIDRGVYINARATGMTIAKAVLLAGGTDARGGYRIEHEHGIKEGIVARKREIAIELHSDWEKCLKVLAKIRDSKKSTNFEKIKAITLFAKIGGHLAPQQVEVKGAVVVTALDRGAMDAMMRNKATRDIASQLLEAHVGIDNDGRD